MTRSRGRADLRGPHLADSSAWGKVRSSEVLSSWFNDQVLAGRIWTCDVVVLEILHNEANHDAYLRQSTWLRRLRWCVTTDLEIARTHEVQSMLSSRGRHRGISPADLLIAAVAESSRLPLLHYDHHFDLIAGVTGQDVRWVAPRGSLH